MVKIPAFNIKFPHMSILSGMLTIAAFSIHLAQAKTPENKRLIIKPQTCVSLHQGQQCFVNLKLSWQMPTPNDYCLYYSAQIEPVKCWLNSSQGIFLLDFSADQSTRFWLTIQNQQQILAESELTVSWVYKKQQKSRLTWRLF